MEGDRSPWSSIRDRWPSNTARKAALIAGKKPLVGGNGIGETQSRSARAQALELQCGGEGRQREASSEDGQDKVERIARDTHLYDIRSILVRRWGFVERPSMD